MRTQPFRHLYVHIPFCRHKCGYCDFNAYAGMDRVMPDYVTALNAELTAAREARPFGPLRTVYLGGGTPSLLPPDLIASVLDQVRSTFDVEPDAEVTLEAGTLLFRRRAAGRLPEVETDLQWDQLDVARRELDAAGFNRYEVSNWARPGFESRHNFAYWRCAPVYGAGAGAHSYATDGL